MNGNALPVTECRRALQFLLEPVPESSIPIDGGLRGFRFVLEHAPPGGEGGEGEGVAHVDLARQRQGRSLRARAARDHRRRLAQGRPHRLGDVVAVEHGDEGDRPAALGEHEIEQLQFRIVHHPDLLGHGDFDRALAALFQRVAVGLQLLAARVAAGERPAGVAHVLVEQRAGKAERAGIDRLSKQCFYMNQFIKSSRALHRRLAHDVVAERRERREEGEVERGLARRGRVHELREGLPVPGDALGEHLEGDRLHVDEIAHGDLARLGPAGRDADAAIAHHHRGHAVPGGGRERPVPADLRVVMRVRIDEAGRNREARGVDGSFDLFLDSLFHGKDLSIQNPDIGSPCRRPAAVDHEAVLDEQIAGHRLRRSLPREDWPPPGKRSRAPAEKLRVLNGRVCVEGILELLEVARADDRRGDRGVGADPGDGGAHRMQAGCRLIGVAAEGHGAQAQFGDFDAGAAEKFVFHPASSSV